MFHVPLVFLWVVHGCFEDVVKVFRGKVYSKFQGSYKLIQEDSSGVPRMIVSCSLCASWVGKGCVKSV